MRGSVQGSAFWGLDDKPKCLGGKIPQNPNFSAGIAIWSQISEKFKSQYLRKCKSDRRKILNIASGHQADFVGGLKIKSNQIQDGGRPPFLKKENVHNLAAVSDIFTKFGVLVAMDSPESPLCHFWAKTKSKMAAVRHFENSISQ